MDLHTAIQLLVDGDAASGWVVRSPAVGMWESIPEDGSSVEGDRAGVLTQGHRRIALHLPAGVRGIVRGSPRAERRRVAVEWGQTLFRLDPLGEAATEVEAGVGESASTAGIFPAPTDGVFYSRSSPSAAPFVKPGDTVRRGQAVGLIEVMKTFNQILFEGDGLPDEGVVEAVLVGDGEEVRAGEALLRLGRV